MTSILFFRTDKLSLKTSEQAKLWVNLLSLDMKTNRNYANLVRPLDESIPDSLRRKVGISASDSSRHTSIVDVKINYRNILMH